MSRNIKIGLAAGMVAIVMSLVPFSVSADDRVEKAGVAVGVSAGNMLFIPVKAITLIWGAVGGALSYALSAGNEDLTRQIWDDTLRGPYVITPELARESIGERPELQNGQSLRTEQ
ncbi:MAG: hypothetical protein HY695_03490 [Deltaproteobacteria bacterium]|nr:hypothetical protein [Deltaproteobacteria bacterium]